MKIIPGLYEEIISEHLNQAFLNPQNSTLDFKTEEMDEEETHMLLSKYLAKVLESAFAQFRNKQPQQIDLANQLISYIAEKSQLPEINQQRIPSPELLWAVLEKINTATAINKHKKIVRPITSLAQSSLFTGTQKEPSLASELKKEILTSNKIDMLVSFVKWSGIVVIANELKEFTSRQDSQLRIITTSYMKATDYKAIEFLFQLPNTEVKISYDTNRTRLHAKAYLFHRDTGFTTAYIGSSNLSNPALTEGLEWNLKVTAKDSNHIIQKCEGTFEAYWNDQEFVRFGEHEKERLQAALRPEQKNSGEIVFYFDVQPYSFQAEILERLKAEREIHQRFRNLIVAATGTGKTVISAFDYKGFSKQSPQSKNRLLFVAHRKEILQQSLACFRAVLKDQNFGSLLVGHHSPDQIDHLFISIQSFNSKDFQEQTKPDFYDFIVVDEFHHAAANSYQTLLNYYQPKILLGLTATPERMDGKNISDYFENVIAAEIRLSDALNRKLLCPFQYFGVSDVVNYEQIKWVKGFYDKQELERNLNTDERLALIIQALNKYVRNIGDAIGLRFCVSVEHAQYMAQGFNRAGISALALTGETPIAIRDAAQKSLTDKIINFIFVVDIYNEGVDIPELDTVLFLRPTESLTIFLQQLGRGLRLSPGKECLTVLDFIGQAHKNYNFEAKFKAMNGPTKSNLVKEMEDDFPHLPAGCLIQLEKLSKEYVLNNIRATLNNTRSQLTRKIQLFTLETGKPLSLTAFVAHYELNLYDVYDKGCWHRLLMDAGLMKEFNQKDEIQLTKGIKRLLHINSRRFIRFIQQLLETQGQIDLSTEINYRFALMLHYNLWFEEGPKVGFASLQSSLNRLLENDLMIAELNEVMNICYEEIEFIDKPIEFDFELPLDLYCHYTRDEILAAVGFHYFDKKKSQREGVVYLSNLSTDIFFITLNKSEKAYSPTTMYEDYAISEKLFHWQSQSTTSDQSVTGKRYINQRKNGTTILLFVRENKRYEGMGAPYHFLGKANYVKHEGSKPISIVWELLEPIPAHLWQESGKIIIG